MQCPNCHCENPNDTQRCSSCGCVLIGPDAVECRLPVKTSRSTISILFLAGLSVILCIFVGPTLAFLAALIGFLVLTASVVETIRGKKRLGAKRVALGIFILVEIVLLSYWRIDAAPIPDDYTIKDLKSATSSCVRTYVLLSSLADKKDDDLTEAPAIGLSSQDIESLKAINEIFKEDDLQTISEQLQLRAEDVLLLWQHAKKGRDVLAKLDAFPEIADLTEPYLASQLFWAENFRHLFFLTRAYICLQSCQGNHQIAVEELMRLRSISGKLSLSARYLVTKLLCFAYVAIAIDTTNFIINNPQTPCEIVLLLKHRMVPVSGAQVSLRNPIIFEYLTFKNELKKLTHEPRFRYSYYSPLKLNSALRLYRDFCDRWISISEDGREVERFRVWPALYVDLPVRMGLQDKLPWYYKAYNPVGSCVASMLTPALNNVIEIRAKLQVRSDLLQIVLDKRLGRAVSLKARAYGDEYIVDVENKKIFSPGPDGKPGTKDDIKLLINPEVLGWSAGP